jgi:DNA-binding response OmpR family regulator
MKLLIIEDEISLLESMADYFRKESFLCATATGFTSGLEKVDAQEYDCIILDINLPGGNGLKILQFLREERKQDGVMIISAKDSLDDRVMGLDLGADDYLTKPFHLPELSARVKAIIRRKYTGGPGTLEYKGFSIDLSQRQAVYLDQPLSLTKKEYDLLLYMLNNKNRVVSRQAIAGHLTGEEADNTDFVYSHIRNLKKKLKETGCGDCIRPVYGFGYKFELE